MVLARPEPGAGAKIFWLKQKRARLNEPSLHAGVVVVVMIVEVVGGSAALYYL